MANVMRGEKVVDDVLDCAILARYRCYLVLCDASPAASLVARV